MSSLVYVHVSLTRGWHMNLWTFEPNLSLACYEVVPWSWALLPTRCHYLSIKWLHIAASSLCLRSTSRGSSTRLPATCNRTMVTELEYSDILRYKISTGRKYRPGLTDNEKRSISEKAPGQICGTASTALRCGGGQRARHWEEAPCDCQRRREDDNLDDVPQWYWWNALRQKYDALKGNKIKGYTTFTVCSSILVCLCRK